MARQRFIWPEIWKDPVFGRLAHDEQVLFIGLFSIADDEGRTNADPAYLRGELFTYKDYTVKRVKAIRDRVVQKCEHIHLYKPNGLEYIALLKWSYYQKPKYPSPSKIPPPFPEDSPTIPGNLPEDSPNGSERLPPRARARITRGVGLGREELNPAVDVGANDASAETDDENSETIEIDYEDLLPNMPE